MDGYRIGQRARPEYELDVAHCQLRRGGKTVPVSDRDFSIIASLAIHGKPISPAELGSMVLPGVEERVAINALKVSIHRLRARVGDAEIIRYSHQAGGYHFGSVVSIRHSATTTDREPVTR